jgi:hypothetical protein
VESLESFGLTLTTVASSYDNPRLMPLLAAHSPNGLNNERSAGEINMSSIAFDVYENDDLGASS